MLSTALCRRRHALMPYTCRRVHSHHHNNMQAAHRARTQCPSTLTRPRCGPSTCPGGSGTGGKGSGVRAAWAPISRSVKLSHLGARGNTHLPPDRQWCCPGPPRTHPLLLAVLSPPRVRRTAKCTSSRVLPHLCCMSTAAHVPAVPAGTPPPRTSARLSTLPLLGRYAVNSCKTHQIPVKRSAHVSH